MEELSQSSSSDSSDSDSSYLDNLDSATKLSEKLEEDFNAFDELSELRKLQKKSFRQRLRDLWEYRKLDTWLRRRKPYTIFVNDHKTNKRKRFPSNTQVTSKYTWWNFPFKVVLEQFRKVSNCYFLLIIIIQFIPGLSPILPITSVLPLAFVILIAAIKEGIEDIFRHRDDNKVNNSLYSVLRHGKLQQVKSSSIKPGDIVKIKNGIVIPADLVLFSSSFPDGSCYITTANLDGETNLKLRKAIHATAQLGTDEYELLQLKGALKVETPNEHIYKFLGTYEPEYSPDDHKFFKKHKKTAYADPKLAGKPRYALDEEQLLPRGAQLRNTKTIYGFVAYSGRDTKMSLNLRSPPSKMSSIDRMLNFWVFVLFGILATVVILLSVFSVLWEEAVGDDHWYLEDSGFSSTLYGVRNGGTWIILLSNFVPISLFVTIELVKVGQAVFMTWDDQMRSKKGESMKVKTSNLNEDLGKIQHIFTDKTGTLTENVMKFSKCTIGGRIFTSKLTEMESEDEFSDFDIDQNEKKKKKSTKFFGLVKRKDKKVELEESDSEFMEEVAKYVAEFNPDTLEDMGSTFMDEEDEMILKFNQIITLCNAVVPEPKKDGKGLLYRTPSPDEKALVEASAASGFVLISRTTDTITVSELGKIKEYKILAKLSFTSERKRMSVVIRDVEEDRIYLFTKGADDIMYKLLANDNDPELKNVTRNHLRDFAKEGLRTLVMGFREMDEEEYEEFKHHYEDAMITINKEVRAEKIQKVNEMVEKNLYLIGGSAIEDKLQDEVPETIDYLLKAGIKVWVLTGDKQETAIEIGYSTKLLGENMDILLLNAPDNTVDSIKLIDAFIHKYHKKKTFLRDKWYKNWWKFWRWYAICCRKEIKWYDPDEMDDLHLLDGKIIKGAKSKSKKKKLGLVVDGETLKHVLKDHLSAFISLADACDSVVCCRTSPLQKALVVRAIKRGEGRISLAIGDGANDVSMIQKAHVGIGIFGKEGTQAARAADYAIHQFKHLKRLLVVHGRNNLIRSAGLIQFSFYKNICYILSFVWFSFFSAWTAQTLYDSW
eukprot:CAMPEP_0174265016 /NCGR_PEP_ID=MMETSP0439-20130205/24844_1 /TAXON_ID=0 /ORGANISM="Stereomyxa ramosa, Strain Chinc5" /LENGTH=1052 /DNA_ID=CAMNT_0015351215 /DNA_START=97 /DNA_END=3252 /DNA_ORIENTATION=+